MYVSFNFVYFFACKRLSARWHFPCNCAFGFSACWRFPCNCAFRFSARWRYPCILHLESQCADASRATVHEDSQRADISRATVHATTSMVTEKKIVARRVSALWGWEILKVETEHLPVVGHSAPSLQYIKTVHHIFRMRADCLCSRTIIYRVVRWSFSPTWCNCAVVGMKVIPWIRKLICIIRKCFSNIADANSTQYKMHP